MLTPSYRRSFTLIAFKRKDWVFLPIPIILMKNWNGDLLDKRFSEGWKSSCVDRFTIHALLSIWSWASSSLSRKTNFRAGNSGGPLLINEGPHKGEICGVNFASVQLAALCAQWLVCVRCVQEICKQMVEFLFWRLSFERKQKNVLVLLENMLS